MSDLGSHGANLSEADLSEANLSEAHLSEAHLKKANLSNADLSEANLSNADLRGADLSEAIIFDTIFANVDLSAVAGLDSIIHGGPSRIDQSTLELSGTLPISFLRGCGFDDEIIQITTSLFGSVVEFFSCFISYSSGDKEFARRLYDALQGRGVRCGQPRQPQLRG